MYTELHTRKPRVNETGVSRDTYTCDETVSAYHVHQGPERDGHLGRRGADGNQDAVQEEGNDVGGEHAGAEEEDVEVELLRQGDVA